MQLIRQYPQCAYLRGRSTNTALRVVYEHCFAVRNACSKVRLNVHQQHHGQTRTIGSGGLQLSLDLTAAFDLIHWSDVKQALGYAGVNIATQEIIILWLSQVRYLFRHKHMRGYVRPKWGLRQGCTGSPTLWAAVTALLCAHIDQHTRTGWSHQHLVLYADDSHLRWRFSTLSDFEVAMNELRQVFACFKQFHLCINYEKTKAILKVVGNMKHRIYKDYVRKHNNGRRLLLMPGDPTHWLPLVSQAEYLGLIISYDQYEQQSMRHRVTKAHGRRWALASILHSSKVRIKYKLSVWRSCVYSTMMYGMATCGLSGDQIKEIQRAIMKHVRAIVNNQAHITGDSHATIRQKFDIPQASDDIAHHIHQVAKQQQLRPDWMYTESWQQHLLARQQLLHEQLDEDERAESLQWACPHCEALFPTQAALKIHARRTHQHCDAPDIVFNKSLHSIGGLPTCRFCLKKFTRWQTLAQHISANRCPKYMPDLGTSKSTYDHQPVCKPTSAVLPAENTIADDTARITPETIPDVAPLGQKLEVIALARKGLNAFIRHPKITQQLRQTCGLCGQWIASHRTVKRRYQYSHADVLRALGDRTHKYVQRTATACPTCHFCNVRCKDWREHVSKCTTTWQCAILCLLSQEPGSSDGGILRSGETGATGGRCIEAPPAPVRSSGPTRVQELQGPGISNGRPAQRRLSFVCAGKAGDKAGPGDKNSSSGPRPDMVHATRRSQHLMSPLQDSQAVHSTTTGQSEVGAGTTATQGCHGHCPVHRTGSPVGEGLQRRRIFQENQRTRMEGSSGGLVLPDLEPDSTMPRSRQQPDPFVRSAGGSTLAEVDSASSHSGLTPSILVHQKDDGNHGRHSFLHDGLVHQNAPGYGSLDLPAGSSRMHGSTVGRTCLQARGLQAEPGHPENQGDDSAALATRLALENRGHNLCYMNSLVQVIQWLLDAKPSRLDALGTGRNFFHSLRAHSSASPKNLMQDTHWCTMVEGWSEHYRQHDAAEFLAHLNQTQNITLFQGVWNARRLHGGQVRISDVGFCTQPVFLSFPRTPPGLPVRHQVQSLMDFWSGAQRAVHAFSAPPQVLVLQLGRFHNVSGHVQKRRDPVDVDSKLVVPIFVGGALHVSTTTYDLKATIMHHGPHPRAGHYTAHLFAGQYIWSCDDNRRAKSLTEVARSHDTDCYLLIYERSPLSATDSDHA